MTYRCSKPLCLREYHQDDYQIGLHCVCGALIIQDLMFRVSILKDKQVVEESLYPSATFLEIGRLSSRSTSIPDIDLGPYLDGQKMVSKSHLTLLLKENGGARIALQSEKNPILINQQMMRPGEKPQVFNIPFQIKVSPKLLMLVEQA